MRNNLIAMLSWFLVISLIFVILWHMILTLVAFMFGGVMVITWIEVINMVIGMSILLLVSHVLLGLVGMANIPLVGVIGAKFVFMVNNVLTVLATIQGIMMVDKIKFAMIATIITIIVAPFF